MRKGGNTDLLVDAFVKGAEKNNNVEVVSVADYKVNPCIGCNSCFDRAGHECFQQDDMQVVYDKLKCADVIVVASPVYFYGVSAQLKAIIDRLHTPSPVCTYKKDTMLCDVSNAKMILEYGWLSYSMMFDRKIRVGESFTTKICYHKDCIVSGMMSSIMFMCLEDCNNRFWNQPLFAPNNKIYDSYEITYKEYKDEYLPDSAIECFKKPWLW